MGKITKTVFVIVVLVVCLLIATSVSDENEVIGYSEHGIPITKKDLKD